MPATTVPRPERPRSQPLSRVVATAYVVVLALSLVAGLRWGAAELGSVPHYGDSREYLELAEELRVDAYRGIGYPLLLAGLGRLVGASALADFPTWEEAGPCVAPAELQIVQWVQIAVGVAALAIALSVLARPLGLGRLALVGLVLVPATDPLVLHLETAILTDAPALAGSLCACAALSRLATTGALAPSAVAFGLAFVATSLLRVEKTWVLAATALATAVWLAWRRSGRVRAAVVLGTAAGSVALVLAIGSTVATDHGRWTLRESVLHQRVVFPNLTAIRSDLPRPWKRRIDRATAERYDEHIRFARREVNRLAAGDPAVRAELTDVLAREAWRQRGWAIARDVLADACENVFATVSFLARGLLFEALGEERFRELVHTDGVAWTLTRLTQHHPGRARAHLALGAAAFAAALPLAVLGVRRRRRAAGGAGTEVATGARALVPFALFVVANACAFALMADLVHIRYAVLAHVFALACVHGSALGWAASVLRAPRQATAAS